MTDPEQRMAIAPRFVPGTDLSVARVSNVPFDVHGRRTEHALAISRSTGSVRHL